MDIPLKSYFHLLFLKDTMSVNEERPPLGKFFKRAISKIPRLFKHPSSVPIVNAPPDLSEDNLLPEDNLFDVKDEVDYSNVKECSPTDFSENYLLLPEDELFDVKDEVEHGNVEEFDFLPPPCEDYFEDIKDSNSNDDNLLTSDDEASVGNQDRFIFEELLPPSDVLVEEIEDPSTLEIGQDCDIEGVMLPDDW